MNKLQREMVAFQLRDDGKKLKDIAKHFGLSIERVRQMIASHIKREQVIESNPDDLVKHMICAECSITRILNCLKNDGYTGDVNALASGGGKRLLRVKNLGQKSIKTIANSLLCLGKIEDVGKWIRT